MKKWISNSPLKRVLSMLMVLAMVLSFITPVTGASAEPAAKTLYLKANGNWLDANARFTAYFYGKDDAGEVWADMKYFGGTYYQVTVPDGYPNVILFRMNPATTENNWNNKWNQTADLTVPTDSKNCFVLTEGEWGGGTWDTFDAESFTPEFYVAGDEALCGEAWNVNGSANKMTATGNGIYEKVYENIEPGTYNLKVTSGTWNPSWGKDGSNYSFTLEQTAKVTVAFYMPTMTVSVTSANYHNITVDSAITGGSVAVAENAAKGDSVTVTVTPDAQMAIDTLTVTGDSGTVEAIKDGNGYTFTMPDSDVTVTATFKAATYAVTVSTAEGGKVEASPVTSAKDGQVTLTITPDEGKELDTLTVKDAQDQDVPLSGEGNTRTFTMPGSAVTVTPTFKDAAPTTVTVYFQNNWQWTDVRVHYWGEGVGTTEPGEVLEVVGQDGNYDMYKAVLPVDIEGFQFSGIKNDGSGNRDETPDLSNPVENTAYYMKWDNGNQCGTYTYPPSGGTTPPEPGDPVTVKVHYHNVSGWTIVNGYVWESSGSNNTWPGVALEKHPYNPGWYTLTVTNDDDVFKCIFNNKVDNEGTQSDDIVIDHSEALEFWVDNSKDAVSTAPDGWRTDNKNAVTVNAPADGGTVTANVESAAEGETVTLTITPADGKELDTLTVKDAQDQDVAVSGEGNTRTFTMPASAVTVTATFKDVETAAVDYYLIGHINGADHGCNDDYANLGDYKFADGKLTATFTQDSYVFVKTGDNTNWFMADTYCTGKTVTLKNTATGAAEKLFVPANTKLNFTLAENADGTLTLSYETVDYYLFGYINGANYGCEKDYENLGDYKFVDGKVTATFTADTYVAVKTGDNAGWYMTDGYLGEVTSATLYDSTAVGANANKLIVPINVELVFTLTENADGTLTLSYEQAQTGDSDEYEVTFHFANTLNWGSVNLYSWLPAGGNPTGGWPGTTLSQDENGFYSYTVKYTAATNEGLNFIFNNGSTQTVDLTVAPTEFTDNKAEKWIVLTTQTDGKYKADLLDSGDSIAVSPIVKDNDVTFQYKNASATSVEVVGTFCQWNAANAVPLTKNEHGIWSVTVNDIAPGMHQYKFIVDGADDWIADPLNTWTENGNSVFLISDPSKDINKVTIRVHYTRADNSYEGWNIWAWNENMTKQFDFTAGTNEVVSVIELPGRTTQKFSFKIRLSQGSNKWVKEETEVNVDLSTTVSGTVDVYVTAGSTQTSQKVADDIVYANKIADVQYDYENGTLIITTNKAVKDASTAFDVAGVTLTLSGSEGSTYTYTLSKELPLGDLGHYKVKFNEDINPTYRDTVLYEISCDYAYATDRFAEEYYYDGKDLGSTYTANSTTFKVWAPTAEKVILNLYSTGSDAEEGASDLGEHEMVKGEKGVWTVTVSGDLKNVYYTYSVTVGGETVETIDPYARAAGVNGKRGMVVDLDSTDPTGWAADKNPNPISSYTDAVIYELHVRDFSIDASSGISAGNRGKFLAFTERGTTVGGEGNISTGVDYLKDLGITHLHLLPIYDYGSVDETALSTPQYNWGYDPVNYNIPEGSYSSNPYDGNVRINEMKQMVQALHSSGISVVMDVVYNHVYDADTFSYNLIVPGYFSRVDSNRSGCGNDTASEREMVRKYIVESVLYWAEEYHIDGFRFDLVGLIDVTTINQIVNDVHAVRPDIIFYGEGWEMDGTNKEPGTEMAKQDNAYLPPGFAYFSDDIRNLLGGENGSTESSKLGFVTGKSNGKEGAVVSNFLANPGWTKNPAQVIQYVSCHDNYTMADKLILSTQSGTINPNIFKMNNLAASIYLTSQGVPFIHAGEEFLREKLTESGGRSENSYNAPDSVNHISWDHLKQPEYAANVEYYKGLIDFRQAHPALRLTSASDIEKYVINQEASGSLVSFWINCKQIAGETNDSIYLIFNANTSAASVTLPAGDWDVYINGEKAGITVLDTVSGTVSVPAISALVLVQETSTEEPEPPAPKSEWALPGDFNGWNQSNFMAFADNSTTVVTQKLSLPAGTFGFKVKHGNDWYGNSGTIANSTDTPLVMDTASGNCTIETTGGEYTFTFDTTTKKLTVTHDPNSGSFGDPNDYYLYGYINGADYATGIEPGDYKFVDGKLTVTFQADSYVCVKNGNSSKMYMTDGWLGSVTSATMYDTKKITAPPTADKFDKLMVPGGVEVVFTLVVNDDDTVTLSYVQNVSNVVDESGVQDGLTLHCWNWSFAEIEKNMATIAAQGYTAIQTSPVQPLKEATNLDVNSVGSHWWVYYQPVDFTITTASGNALGTKAELASMIETAHRYGIQVIVDVVANHLGNQTGNDLSDAIPEALRKDEYWHDITVDTSDYDNRYDVTQHCMSGLPDLNTANKDIQGFVLEFMIESVNLAWTASALTLPSTSRLPMITLPSPATSGPPLSAALRTTPRPSSIRTCTSTASCWIPSTACP